MRTADPTEVYDLALTPAQPLRGAVHHTQVRQSVRGHMHPAFEIGVQLAGRQERHCKRFVWELAPGDVWLVPAWERHSWRSTTPHAAVFVLEFLPGFIGEEFLDGRSWLTLFAAAPADRPRVTEGAMREEVLALGQRLGEEVARQEPGWMTAVRLGALGLLFLISRGWTARPGVGLDYLHATKLQKIMPALQLVYDSPHRRVGLGEAAALSAMGESHFDVTFRRVMGLSFGRFALRFRLSCAAGELASGNLPVEAMAGKFGFADLSHFTRTFKRIYQASPVQYRRESSLSRPSS